MYEVGGIIVFDIAVHKNKGWFFNWGYNAIFEINFDTGMTRLEAFFDENYEWEKESFGGIEYYKDKLYMGPRRGTQILIYDLITKECSLIDIDLKMYGETENYNLIQRVIEIGGNIYFFPGRFHAIIRLNPENNELTYIDDWYKAVKNKWSEADRNFVIFNNVDVSENGNCIMGCRRSDFIVKVNIFTGEYFVVETDLKGKIYDAVYSNETYIISLKDESAIYKIDKSEIDKIDVGINNNSLWQICINETNLFIVPRIGLDIIKVDLNSYRSEIIYSFSKEKNELQSGNMCFKKQINKNTMLMFSNITGNIILLNTLSGAVSEKKLLLDNDSRMKIQKCMNRMFSKAMFYESETLGLKEYLEAVKNH